MGSVKFSLTMATNVAASSREGGFFFFEGDESEEGTTALIEARRGLIWRAEERT